MPLQDFALDAAGNHRIQVHWATETDPITVLLNRSPLGTISTPEEHVTGKDFTLPDGSILHVGLHGNQIAVLRNGYPLMPLGLTTTPETTSFVTLRKRSGCMTAWLIGNLVLSILYLAFYLFIFAQEAVAGYFQISPFILIAIILVDVVEIVGVCLLFAWKKVGFYLYATPTVVTVLLNILFRQTGFTFIPSLAGLGLFYYWLQRSNVWDHLK